MEKFYLVEETCDITSSFKLKKGTIFALKEFYRCGSTTKDIELVSGSIKFNGTIEEFHDFTKSNYEFKLKIKKFDKFKKLKKVKDIFKKSKSKGNTINTLINRSCIYVKELPIVEISPKDINSKKNKIK